jgi:GT2 family glycosyltransferase
MTSLEKYDCAYISIIILTYNGAGYILPLLKSLFEQTYPLAGNNQGYLHAQHDLMVFLNQDTICHPDFLKVLVRKMQEDKSLAACNPNIIPLAPSDSIATDRRLPVNLLHLCDLSPYGYGRNRIISDKYFVYTKLLSGCAFIIRRAIVKNLGYLYDDQLWMYAEDTDLSLRIHRSGLKIGAVKDAVIYHLHDQKKALNRNRLSLATRAIMNRVYIFFKNMRTLEFLLFYPFLLLGGNFKIFEFSMPTIKQIFYFIPFSLFSMVCMLCAGFRLNRFSTKKGQILRKYNKKDFSILKLVLKI